MPWKDTRATRLFNVELPIVLGPFGGLSSVQLSATVSEAGGLGSYGLYGYEAGRITATARWNHGPRAASGGCGLRPGHRRRRYR